MARPDTSRGCPSTRPSTANSPSFPKELTFTFEVVRVISLRFWPVRMLSYAKVTTSMDDEVDDELTVRVATLLVTEPRELVMTTRYCWPLFAVVATGVVYEAEVAPEIAVPASCHW